MQPKLPFPIAFCYHLIAASRDATERYERLLQCYESVVHYCAMVQISDYLSSGCPSPDVNRKLLQYLPRELSLGNWVELTRDITSIQKRGVFRPFMPELMDFYFQTGKGTKLTPAGSIFDSTLCALRNEWAHREETWSREAYTTKFKEQKEPLLDRMLGSLDFLSRYTVYVPYRGTKDVVREALVLMGPNEPPELETQLHLTLNPSLREQVQYEASAVLVSSQDSSRQLLLHPLSIFANRDGVEDLFLFQSCHVHKDIIRRLIYRGIRFGQKPLVVLPGSDMDPLVAGFQNVVRLLGSPFSERNDNAEVEDVAADCLTIQKALLEEHCSHFVGRIYVQEKLKEFLAQHSRGYFIIRSGPGQGKTAVACNLVKTNGYVHHFVSRTNGRSDPRLILLSLLAQILPHTPLDQSLPSSIAALTRKFEKSIEFMIKKTKPAVLVIDGLDELAEDPSGRYPFLLVDGLPEGMYVVVTSRPGTQLDLLEEQLFAVPHLTYDLGPLELTEMREILKAQRSDLPETVVERIADASQGNPLFLRAVSDEMQRDSGFDPRNLPSGVEGFFRAATAGLNKNSESLLLTTLGVMAVARKPLSLAELSQIIDAKQRQVFDSGIRPVRQFLTETRGTYNFYHDLFHQFVTREIIYPDEIPEYHRKIAAWLQMPESRAYDYYWTSIAYHLFESKNFQALGVTIDRNFLSAKVRRFGYAVLEDVELLTRTMLEAGDPTLVAKAVSIVEELREIVGGDIIEDTEHALRSYRPGPMAFRTRVIAPIIDSIPRFDVFVGVLPAAEVSADFFEIVSRDDRLSVAIGDAPNVGLKSAFVARFLGNLFRKFIENSDLVDLGKLLDELNATVSSSEYFERVSMQCVVCEPKSNLVKIANAGHPYPVLYSARRGKCELLPVRGDLLQSAAENENRVHPYEQRRMEMGPQDVLILVTDGLTEGHLLKGDPYGYRFMGLVEERNQQGARLIGEAILDGWRAHHREGDYADDVSVIVIRSRPTE
jgi:hypothetical protein